LAIIPYLARIFSFSFILASRAASVLIEPEPAGSGLRKERPQNPSNPSDSENPWGQRPDGPLVSDYVLLRREVDVVASVDRMVSIGTTGLCSRCRSAEPSRGLPAATQVVLHWS
jgi:hypothetical protein